MMENKELAEMFTTAIKTIADKSDNLENLKNYLSYHFDEWIENFANSPEKLVSEMKNFSEMNIN